MKIEVCNDFNMILYASFKLFEEYWSKEDVQRGLKNGDLVQVWREPSFQILSSINRVLKVTEHTMYSLSLHRVF